MSELNIYLLLSAIVLFLIKHQVFSFKTFDEKLKKIRISKLNDIIAKLTNSMNNQMLFLQLPNSSIIIFVEKLQYEDQILFTATIKDANNEKTEKLFSNIKDLSSMKNIYKNWIDDELVIYLENINGEKIMIVLNELFEFANISNVFYVKNLKKSKLI